MIAQVLAELIACVCTIGFGYGLGYAARIEFERRRDKRDGELRA